MRTLLFSLVMLMCFSLAFLACGQKEADTQAQQEEAVEATEGELAANMAIDPVCGMKVNTDEAQFTVEHGGETYYFCMEADKTTFTEQPDKYLAQK